MRHRTWRYIVQYIALGICFLGFLSTFLEWKPYRRVEWTGEEGKGFVAISYEGVCRRERDKCVTAKQLREQLRTLKALGYETIGQQQLIDYYQRGDKLPDKALFLMFEDGRKDTVKLATPILEEMNYQATMLTFGEKLEKRDYKFLSCSQITQNSHWELGTNGYRMAYINETTKKNHYLMDFIRDGDKVPLENQSQMRRRISLDYERLKAVYEKQNGDVPKVYALMHSNTGQFGSHHQLSVENERHIYELFSCNFNRVGSGWNDRGCSPYNLTRIQPDGQWTIAHLLLAMGEKPENPLEAADGYAKWLEGELELTTSLNGVGRAVMGVPKNNQYRISYEPVREVQSGVLLRCRYEVGQYVRITTTGRELHIEQCLAGDRTKRVLCHKRLAKNPKTVTITCREDALCVTLDGTSAYTGRVLVQEPGNLQFVVKSHGIGQQLFREVYIEGMVDRRKGTWQKMWESIRGKAESIYQDVLDS